MNGGVENSKTTTTTGTKTKSRTSSLSNQKDQLSPATIQHYLKHCNDSSANSHVPFHQLPQHDARYDAIHIIVQQLTKHEFPLWAAIQIAVQVVNENQTQLHSKVTPFEDGKYDGIPACEWYHNVLTCLRKTLNDDSGKKVSSRSCLQSSVLSQWHHHFPYSLCSLMNGRHHMEDRHVVLPTLGLYEDDVYTSTQPKRIADQDAFFAVFDGHAGAECADYAAAHFVECLLTAKSYQSDPMNALKEAYAVFDGRLNARCMQEVNLVTTTCLLTFQNIKSGTTAVCAFIRDNRMHLAWCGDSAMGVLRPDRVKTLSRPHSPDDQIEQKRIEAAGGMVLYIQGEARVNGILNISRALGDVAGKPMISSEAEFSTIELTNDDFLLLLSSDGVWDELSEPEILMAIRDFVNTHDEKDYDSLSTFIVKRATSKGATDNMTFIAVFLRPVADLWKEFHRV